VTDGRDSQAGLIALAEITPESRVSQAGLVALGAIVPTNPCSQAGLVVLGQAAPCVTRRCQLWIITRRDGEILRFTSHDEDVTWGNDVYSSCKSLDESASEQSADQGDVGNIELAGILDDDAISEPDLYAGKYDDAFYEVWEKSWDSDSDQVRRVVAGWGGSTSQGEDGFHTEVLGPGARLLQKPLLRTVTPTCRFIFGDPTTCGVDAEALKVAGAAVTVSTSRTFFWTDAVDPANGSQWANGTLTWLTGANAGTFCEVKSVDFAAAGLVVLWQPAGFIPQAGDTFDLKPGCDLAFDGGCAAYSNRDRFGGYPKVPGNDAISQSPDAKAQ
jgi:uncharacterized phage protein (TIGR02218 family)